MPRFSSAVATLVTRFENVVFCLCMRVAACEGCRSPTLPAEMPATVFFAFRDSPVRRRALCSSRGSAERYSLFGLDELAARDFVVRHNLERKGGPQRWAVAAGAVLKRALERAGGYGGDFATVLGSLRRANSADVVFSTVDTVGIPLMLLPACGAPQAAARLRGDRAPGTPCTAALGTDASSLCVRARLVCLRDRLQPA